MNGSYQHGFKVHIYINIIQYRGQWQPQVNQLMSCLSLHPSCDSAPYEAIALLHQIPHDGALIATILQTLVGLGIAAAILSNANHVLQCRVLNSRCVEFTG